MSPDTEQQDRTQCSPCRGTGRLLSSKGGERHEVTCPWCGGSGRFQPGRDAQAAGPAEAGGAGGGSAEHDRAGDGPPGEAR